MSMPAWPSHGGQSASLLAHFDLPMDHPLEDFSANLNPFGPPAWVNARVMEELAGLQRYPVPDYAAARRAIADHHQLTPDQVLLTNGGAEAIFLAAALHAGQRAAVITPSFGEYARACRAHRLSVNEIPLAAPDFRLRLDALLSSLDDIEVLFLCRPNNPTATLIDRDAMQVLLERTAALGCRVVVDEAFIDMAGDTSAEVSLTAYLGRYPHLILLHSLTKFFTLPGLRLGYLLADGATINAAAAHQPPWSVNHIAAQLVTPLLADKAFAERTRQWITLERPRMAVALARLGLEVVPSQACFFLIRPGAGHTINSDELFERLLRRGVLVRHTHNFAGLDGEWLRLALRDASANQRLLKALHDCLR